ncbi:hypothetical protein CGLO_16409 [Colletotrichum gloeosporioides Cg-14]|uniref:DUF676 domain-containing protein n=1 Tax=Colletotrichum gloeosporioides (strain Cg-14) TaxID=1237896 RepID=T0L9D9_COLGC|nr:hypothetical protein CGLO_16409 [Colletotrichum gloeosporioides Cg-14]
MATRKEKAWTYRVERIPFGTTPEALIKQYFEPDDQSYLEVRSLCPDVALPEGEGGHGNGQLTATVYFKPKDSRPDGPRPQKSRIKVSREFVGFTPLFVPPAGTPIVADIIAVTGLAGNAYGSWAHDENEMWLRDSLQFTAPNARILTYGYVSKVENGCSFGILQDHACAFLVNLLLMRDEGRCESRPIIFIGHSLGCLIVKKAMIDAASRGINMARLPVRAIIFLAAPHKGLDVEALQTLFKGQPSETLVHELKKGSPTLLELNTKFSQIAGDIDILTCYEMKQTKQAVILENGKWAREGSPVIMVDRDSAILFMEKEKAVGVDADHSEIAKIEEGQGGIFPSVKAAIRNALRPTVSFAGNNQFVFGAFASQYLYSAACNTKDGFNKIASGFNSITVPYDTISNH